MGQARSVVPQAVVSRYYSPCERAWQWPTWRFAVGAPVRALLVRVYPVGGGQRPA